MNNLKLGERESLSNFLGRWKAIYSATSDVGDMEAITYFGNALPADHLCAIDIAKKMPNTIQALMTIVHACIRVEEMESRNPAKVVNAIVKR